MILVHACILYVSTESSNDIGTESAEISDFLAVREAFHAALSLGPCVLVLDGVDELGESHGCSYQQVII